MLPGHSVAQWQGTIRATSAPQGQCQDMGHLGVTVQLASQ